MKQYIIALTFVASAIALDTLPTTLTDSQELGLDSFDGQIGQSRLGFARPIANNGRFSGYRGPAPWYGRSVRPVGPQIINNVHAVHTDTLNANCQCKEIYKPVCANNYVTYTNECIMSLCSGYYSPCQLTKLWDGPCSSFSGSGQDVGVQRVPPNNLNNDPTVKGCQPI